MKGPSEQSSKRPVSKIREIPGLQKKSSLYQDPRFDTARGKADLTQVRRNYAFLDAYREDEIRQMREERKKTRNTREAEQLDKAIQSQSSRLETMRRRDEEAEILRQVKDKKMTRGQRREYVISQRFAKMSSKESARVLDKKRKKVAQKQKKLLPERRGD